MSSDERKKSAITARRLLDFVADVPLTAEEAEAELLRDGVDVDAAIEKALAFVAARRREAREEHRQRLLSQIKPVVTRPPRRDYGVLGRSELMRLAQERQLGAHHRNFSELTVEDLRSLLADADALDDTPEAP